MRQNCVELAFWSNISEAHELPHAPECKCGQRFSRDVSEMPWQLPGDLVETLVKFISSKFRFSDPDPASGQAWIVYELGKATKTVAATAKSQSKSNAAP